MEIHRIRVVGNAKETPKCQRCAKALIFSDEETKPFCCRCALINKIENAVNDLEKNSK
jgi:hypothetical protein